MNKNPFNYPTPREIKAESVGSNKTGGAVAVYSNIKKATEGLHLLLGMGYDVPTGIEHSSIPGKYKIVFLPSRLNPSYLPDLSGSKYPADYVIGVIWGIVTNKQDHAVNRVLKIKKVLIEYGKSVNSQVLVDKPVLSNPPVIIYDNLIEIKAQKKRGNFKGEYFKHTFKPGSKVYGLANGDLLISKR